MELPSWAQMILNAINIGVSGSGGQINGANGGISVPFGGPDNTPASLQENRQISEHFSLYELTVTNNTALQQENRTLTPDQVKKLGELALLMENVRSIVGAPVSIHSGYRCPALNAATVGSAVKSQHMLCEAADWSIAGRPDTSYEVEMPFQKVLAAAKSGQIKFGQLIVESAQRDYGSVSWVHISLGQPYRDISRCGEVLRMTNGSYILIEKI